MPRWNRTPAVEKALYKKYAAPAWALFFEVPNATGTGKSRTADAIAMSLWPSRGLHLHGFEIKSYRNDFLREIKNPAKAEEISRYCDFWWIVTSEPKIAHVDEIPATWGYMTLKGRGLSIVKNAPERKPLAVDRVFLASLLRQQHDNILERPEVRAKIESAREDLESRIADSNEFELKVAQQDLKRAEERIKRFEEASGLSINDWSAGEVGNAVSFLRRIGGDRLRLEKLLEMLESVKRTHEGEVHTLTEAIKNLKNAADATPASLSS